MTILLFYRNGEGGRVCKQARFTDTPIRIYSQIKKPDMVIVLDSFNYWCEFFILDIIGPDHPQCVVA